MFNQNEIYHKENINYYVQKREKMKFYCKKKNVILSDFLCIKYINNKSIIEKKLKKY